MNACVSTNLAASINVEKAHPTSQLLGILDARPQNTGGEIQGGFIRLPTQTQNTHMKNHKLILLHATGRI